MKSFHVGFIFVMKSNYETLIIGILGAIAYLGFVLLVFNALADYDQYVKVMIFKYYNVPLPRK